MTSWESVRARLARLLNVCWLGSTVLFLIAVAFCRPAEAKFAREAVLTVCGTAASAGLIGISLQKDSGPPVTDLVLIPKGTGPEESAQRIRTSLEESRTFREHWETPIPLSLEFATVIIKAKVDKVFTFEVQPVEKAGAAVQQVYILQPPGTRQEFAELPHTTADCPPGTTAGSPDEPTAKFETSRQTGAGEETISIFINGNFEIEFGVELADGDSAQRVAEKITQALNDDATFKLNFRAEMPVRIPPVPPSVYIKQDPHAGPVPAFRVKATQCNHASSVVGSCRPVIVKQPIPACDDRVGCDIRLGGNIFGRAFGFGDGAKHGFMRVAGDFSLPPRSLDFRLPSATATIDALLEQGQEPVFTGVEVVRELPIPLIRRFGSQQSATFETPPGFRFPGSGVDVFARIRIDAGRQVGTYHFQIEAFYLTFDKFEECPAPGVKSAFTIDDGFHVPVQVHVVATWKCFGRNVAFTP